MRFSKYAAFVFLFFCFQTVFSQTVVVTSKEDSGPGTLRAALLSIPANRTATYIINFNLPGAESDYANRTIRLRSQLPPIPSNVVIDGSSQNWPKLGASGAKIIIEPENRNTLFNGLVIGQYYSSNYIQTKNVEIYGLCLRNFAQINNLQNPTGYAAIVIDYRADNIKIGAAGKGNVISGSIQGIQILNSYINTNDPVTANDIRIQGNIIGLSYDGLSPNSNVTGISANLYDTSITIGGDNTGDGNVIAANQTNIDLIRYNYNNKRFEINIINNKIGVNATETADFHELPLFLSSSGLEISGVKVNSYNTQLYMRNNTISGNRGWAVTITNSDFILTGNAIGTNKTGALKLGNGGGIKVEGEAAGTIGGATPIEANLIGYNNYGIESNSSRAVKITRNSMFCNKFISIGKALKNYQPFVQVLKKRANFVSGRATPNSEIEIFDTQNCEGLCEGRTFLKTVQAGSDGKWEYTGTMSSNVTATASLLNATTSQFSTAALLEDDVIVEPVTCKGNGSITLKEAREGFTFQWNKILNDGTRQPRGNGQSATNLEVGDYEVIINDGCKAVATRFEIKDQKLTEIEPVTPVPACGQQVFNFSASVFRGKGNIHFEWKDANGVIVANTYGNSSFVSLPEGKYTVTVTDEANCQKIYNFPEIRRKPSPIIEIYTPITPAACGKNNGAITGVVVRDVTNPRYKWYTYDRDKNQRGTVPIFESSTTPDLENVPGGYYVLVVSDDGGCPPVSSSPVYIHIYDSVTIRIPFNTKPATCGENNGGISGITIDEANKYELFGPEGQSVIKGNYVPGDVVNFSNLAPGRYRINALNDVTGCNKDGFFNINLIEPTKYEYTATAVPTTCDLINGSITIRFANNTPVPSSYTWQDAAGNPVTGASYTNATTLLLPNLRGNTTYTMTAFDANGCSTSFGPYAISVTEKLSIQNTQIPPTNDGCSLSRGAITGLKAQGGIQPYSYSWYTEAGEPVKTNQTTPDLIGVPEGKYYMILTDATLCGSEKSNTYTVENHPFHIAPPVIKESISVCYATDITIKIPAPEEGTYQLYKEATDATPIIESNTGTLVFKVSKTGDYLVRRKLGTCYSDFTKVHIQVTNDNLEVMNTMTPNGDGINDTWVIKGLPEHSDYNIKLYSRSGQLVYESNGKYVRPFDGRFRGSELPAGAYYFVIDLKADCKPLSGSLTLLR